MTFRAPPPAVELAGVDAAVAVQVHELPDGDLLAVVLLETFQTSAFPSRLTSISASFSPGAGLDLGGLGGEGWPASACGFSSRGAWWAHAAAKSDGEGKESAHLAMSSGRVGNSIVRSPPPSRTASHLRSFDSSSMVT